MVYAGVGGIRGMTEAEKLVSLHSPESDCNSNNVDSASYLSNTSSDFVQDNSDYQWFLDYGYRETQHRSILSISDSYEEGCYNEMARDIDSQLAQVDMEDYRAEDILNTLPAICCHELQPSRKGEMFASVSKSILSRLRDFDSSLSPQSTSQEDEEEEDYDEDGGCCRSGPLFSPVREISAAAVGGPTYSVDSLDCDQPDVMLTCELMQANKHNYTIAFEGSTVMDESATTGGETSNTSASGTWSSETANGGAAVSEPVTGAGAGGGHHRTTWCKVVSRRNHRNCMRHSTASLPGTNTAGKRRLDRSIVETRPDRLGGCLKLYDVQHSGGSTGTASDACSSQSLSLERSRLSLLRLFIRQRGCAMTHSECATGTATDHAACDNRPNKNLASCERNQNEAWVDRHQQQSLFADSLMDESESVSVCSCDASLAVSTHQTLQATNNNNSLDRDNSRSPAALAHMRRGTQTRTSSTSSSVSDPTAISNTAVRSSATQCPLHCVDASMQTSLLPPMPPPRPTVDDNKPAASVSSAGSVGGGGKVKRPVYVMYPNYTLPDLGFLRDDRLSLDLEQVVLTPVKFSPGWSPTTGTAPHLPASTGGPRHLRRPRPHSCADIQHLRKKGFSHIRDWESLATLLPPEYCSLLADIPELREFRDLCVTPKPLFCTTPPPPPFQDGQCATTSTAVNCSSSSNSTQPGSSGYRGSSTALTDSSANPSPGPLQGGQGRGGNPMFVYRYDSATTSESGCSGPPIPKRSISLPEDENAPCRPPLPRGILRNSLENAKMHKNQANRKRHSMFDMETADVDDPELAELERNLKAKAAAAVAAAGLSGSDEGIGGEWRPPTPPAAHTLRLQQLLESSGDHWDPEEMDVLRQQVSRFLCQGGRKSVSFADKNGGNGGGGGDRDESESMTPPNSPQASVTHRPPPPPLLVKAGPSLNETTIAEDLEASFTPDKIKLAVKSELVDAVCRAAGRLAQSDQSSQSAAALGSLCPALYALLSDGLCPKLETPFGDINNSVWQVVEASSQQGQMTKALNELVVKLNSEDVLTEGVVKFNAFIFGLLNVQGLDVWLSYLRTRESVLRRHYAGHALLLSACRGEAGARALSDRLLLALRPLVRLPFRLDLLYETRLLHQSLMQLSKLASSPSHSVSSGGSWSLRRAADSPPPSHQHDTRPRSCVEAASTAGDIAGMVTRKRWSVNLAGRLTQAYDRLDDTDDDYTDSLETGGGVPRNSGGGGEEGGDKFRRLQMKWEMLSGREGSQESTPHSSPVKACSSAVPKSRIPRPVTSPQSQTAPGTTAQQHTPRPPIKRPLTAPPSQLRRPSVTPSRGPVKARTSRVDAPAKTGGAAARPSSLPYRGATRPSDALQRRAASSSTVRQPTSTSANRQQHRHVVTLSHRLPSDSGHLAYNEGERLRLVLDVDDTWLLCCRGDAKGLVPRSGVIILPQRP